MRQHNPVVIPRNHHVETFHQVLRFPYEALAQTSEYQDPPSDGDKGYQTFCGT